MKLTTSQKIDLAQLGLTERDQWEVTVKAKHIKMLNRKRIKRLAKIMEAQNDGL